MNGPTPEPPVASPAIVAAKPALTMPAALPATLRQPRWWPAWIGLGVLWVLCRLPMNGLLAFGRVAGRAFRRLSASRRQIVRTNLRLCFPELPEAEREALGKRHFEAIGQGVFETLLALLRDDRHLRGRFEIVGLEHLDAAQTDGSGVLLLTGHFTTMELACRALAMIPRPFNGMFRRSDNAFFDYWQRRWRESRVGAAMLPKDELKTIVRALRNGARVWYGPDQTLEAPGAKFVPFFGVPTLTLTATSRLAAMGRAKIVPYFPESLPGGRYRIIFQPALQNFPSGDDVADARRINAILEDAIRRSPAQYFWIHRKFKYRPPGEPDVYARH
jgi:KDO2-lipid IV(A) lauroyltransferase